MDPRARFVNNRCVVLRTVAIGASSLLLTASTLSAQTSSATLEGR
jgi:hypothetical protein